MQPQNLSYVVNVVLETKAYDVREDKVKQIIQCTVILLPHFLKNNVVFLNRERCSTSRLRSLKYLHHPKLLGKKIKRVTAL